MLEAIALKLLEKAGESAVQLLADRVKEKNEELRKRIRAPLAVDFATVHSTTRAALAQHLLEVKQWSDAINFADLKRRKSIADAYVELDTFLIPQNFQLDNRESHTKYPLLETLEKTSEHCVILGQPGAGKTTSLQRLCSDYIVKGKFLLNYNFPILIRLRDIRISPESTGIGPIYAIIQNLLSLRISYQNPQSKELLPTLSSLSRFAIRQYIDGLDIAILFDGLDEIPDAALRQEVIDDLRSLASGLQTSRLLITCRSGEFPYTLDNTAKFEIAPLEPHQIAKFAAKWLISSEATDDFLSKLRKSPFADTAIRPLTLAHLCAVYERIQDIPEKPRSVYRKIVNLLLEEWDAQRSIKRPSAYAEFDTDRKLEFLSSLAFELSANRRASTFESREIEEAYASIREAFGLPAGQATQVIRELESHSGIIIEAQYKRFEFAHKSLQEFLTAEYIVRLPSLINIIRVIPYLPAELAIATALSSRSTDYLVNLVLNCFPSFEVTGEFCDSYLYRLALEKVDFQFSEAAVLAACILLSPANSPDDHLELLKPLLPMGFHLIMLKHYRSAGAFDGRNRFELYPGGHGYQLPQLLTLPTRLFPSQSG